ncbi:MAG: hypothetical protein ACPG31_09605 [Planctomycetota bacterium]
MLPLFLLAAPQATPEPAPQASADLVHPFAPQEGTDVLLLQWAAGGFPSQGEEFAFPQLRGRIGRAYVGRLATMLADPAIPRRNELLELLLQVPFEESRSTLVDFALDASRPSSERGRVAEFLLLLDGPKAFEDLLPSFHVDAEPPYLRRFFAGWRESIGPEHLPLLEQFVKESPSESAMGQFALQLWARHETDPEARRRIFLHARDASTSFRSTAIEVLARGGPDPVIAAMLREEFIGGSPDLRRLARRMLPSFDSPEALLEAYREHALGQSVNLRGRWMGELASSPLPEAQREAMQWLVDGGWGSGTLANQVVSLLRRSDEVDPLLPALLHHGEIPERVLFPLALARAPFSEDAKAYLLDLFPHGSSVLQMQVLRAVVANGAEEELRFAREVFESNAYASAARALAAEILIMAPKATEYVRNRFDQPMSGDYELDAAWVRSLAASRRLEFRDEGVAAATIASGYEEEDERRGLRIEVWSSLGRTGNPAHAKILEDRLWYLLRHPETGPPGEEGWTTLGHLGNQYPELSVVAIALAKCVDRKETTALETPEDLALSDVQTEPLLVAASLLAKTHPQRAAVWLTELQQRKLVLIDHLRVLALSAHRLPSVEAKREAIKQLLEHPDALLTYRRLLLEAFTPEGTGWVRMSSRLWDRLLLEEVLAEERPLEDLSILLRGYTDDDVLRRAANFAELEGDLGLALELAQRRTHHLPLSDATHAHYALLLGDLQRVEDAQREWAIVERVAPDRSDLWLQARAALQGESQ